MSHDTDPTELTPPDGHRHFSLPPDATREQIIDRFNRLLGVLHRVTDEVTSLHQAVSGGESPCPSPASRCAALEMSETNFIGFVELRSELSKDRRSRHMLTAVLGASAIIISAAMGLGGSLITNRATAAAREQASKVAKQIVIDSTKTTE